MCGVKLDSNLEPKKKKRQHCSKHIETKMQLLTIKIQNALPIKLQKSSNNG